MTDKNKQAELPPPHLSEELDLGQTLFSVNVDEDLAAPMISFLRRQLLQALRERDAAWSEFRSLSVRAGKDAYTLQVKLAQAEADLAAANRISEELDSELNRRAEELEAANRRAEEADYLLGRCLPLLDILIHEGEGTTKTTAQNVRQEIMKHDATQSEQTKKEQGR